MIGPSTRSARRRALRNLQLRDHLRVVREDPQGFHYDWNPPRPKKRASWQLPIWVYRACAIGVGVLVGGAAFAVAWALARIMPR